LVRCLVLHFAFRGSLYHRLLRTDRILRLRGTNASFDFTTFRSGCVRAAGHVPRSARVARLAPLRTLM